MKRAHLRWIVYPVSNYEELIPSMKELALSFGLDPSTLTAYKQRRRCIGRYTKHISEWCYIVDDTFSKQEIEDLKQSVLDRLENEIWKPIFNGDYEVSNYGRVKSVKGKNGSHKTRGVKEQILKQRLRGSGSNQYLSVYLRLDGKGKNYFVHRLVAMAFLHKDTSPGREQDFVVRTSKTKFNNFADNLRWVDERTLKRLSKDNGRQKQILKLDPVTGKELDFYLSIEDAAKDNYVSSQAISKCLLDQSDTCIGFRWAYCTDEQETM